MTRWRWGIALTFLTYCTVVVLSHGMDWDHFYSFFEAERRSWLLDHALPLWSYQLCGGITRIGDPQSFGLSPLFALVLAFGSVAGAKLIWIVSMAVGFVSLTQILKLFDPKPENAVIHESLSFFFLFSNYFFWHSQAGHVAFAPIPFSLFPIWIWIRGVKRGFSLRDAALFLASGFVVCTGAIYYVVVFWAIPIAFLASGSFLQYCTRTKSIAVRIKSLAAGLLLIALVIGASWYKFGGVIDYQRRMPRIVSHDVSENLGIIDLAVGFFVPTWNSRFLGILPPTGQWFIHEYSSFGALPWIAFFMALFYVRKRKLPRLGFGLELTLCFLVLVNISTGGLVAFPTLSNSIRSMVRFQLVLLAVVLITLARILQTDSDARKFYTTTLVPLGIGITLVSALTFFTVLEPRRAIAALSLTGNSNPKMSEVVKLDSPPLHDEMFPTVRSGKIALNCYTPLKIPVHPNGSAGRLLDNCPKAYALQNELVANDCKLPCFRLNDVNPREKIQLHWDPSRNELCAGPQF